MGLQHFIFEKKKIKRSLQKNMVHIKINFTIFDEKVNLNVNVELILVALSLKFQNCFELFKIFES